ncbi:MAG: DUF6273 domain-containing protein [Oscillospiraceae bacterium]|nr:DUF6273 domain-containing protein [Oscillospiraceae bacterium]
MIAPKIGSIIKFGSYDWRVLDVQNDKALIITEEIIENKAYHSDLVDITWADCDLRKYLNGEFINNAKKFSPNDRDRITPVVNRNADNQWYNTNSGSDTTDSIFLLSLEEVREYFGGSMKKLRNVRVPDGWFSDKNDSKRVAKYGKQASWWWLRSPGIYSTSAAIVNIVGSVYVNGNYVHNVHGGIRPALWLNL